MPNNIWYDPVGGNTWDTVFLWSLHRVPIDGDNVYITGPNCPDPNTAINSPITIDLLDTSGSTDPNGFDVYGNFGSSITIAANGVLTIGDTSHLGISDRWFGSDTSNTTATFNDSSFNYDDNINGTATFNDNSNNYDNINGTATFNGNSNNDGNINGTATFNDESYNDDNINGTATFNDSSFNYDGNINGTATFNDSSFNHDGNINGTATFNGNSNNDGNINGTATFNGNSNNDGNINGTAYFASGSQSGNVNGVVSSTPFDPGVANVRSGFAYGVNGSEVGTLAVTQGAGSGEYGSYAGYGSSTGQYGTGT